jgi:hypothetical protein
MGKVYVESTAHDAHHEGIQFIPHCHSLDIRGRTLCGAELQDFRAPHPAADCAIDGHPRCAICDELKMLEGEGVGGELEAA